MNSIKLSLRILAALGLCSETAWARDAPDDGSIAPFFSNYCVKCHGEKRQKGNLNLKSLELGPIKDDRLETWRMIAEQLRFRDMPPEDEKQPPEEERERILAGIRARLLDTQGPGKVAGPKLLLPEFGNHVDHEALFDAPAGPVIPGPPRLWRLRPGSYEALATHLTEGLRGLSRPLGIRNNPEFRDYASLYFVDEPATDLLLRNAELIISNQAQHERFGDIFDALQAGPIPDEKLMADAIGLEFRMALRREPNGAETTRFLKLWKKNLAVSGHPIGTQAALMAVLMQPAALFRLELGAGEPDALGRQRLSQQEIARALSFALRDVPDDTLLEAAEHGGLGSRKQIAAHVQRMLGEPLEENPRILEFFAEFFGYRKAIEVFKDKPARGIHDPRILVRDLELLISHILAADENVLSELLTTNKAFVNTWVDGNDGTRSQAIPAIGFETVYGLPPDWKWTDQQPIELPAAERAGVLTHPAWLVAHSGNFDNDPIRRGKWIRTRLLGGTVPDLPIGVEALIPESKVLTLRKRLHSATSKAECWRCHRKMDPLGLPFEQFTHYGFYRESELGKPVDTGGWIDRTGNPQLDGFAAPNPVEMIRKLAASERVEKVFVRHAFRYFHGRNETLGDATTLQNAWQAYRQENGSFNALVLSFLTSDSFLYRMP